MKASYIKRKPEMRAKRMRCKMRSSVKGLKIRRCVWYNTLIPLIKDVEGGVEYTLNGYDK